MCVAKHSVVVVLCSWSCCAAGAYAMCSICFRCVHTDAAFCAFKVVAAYAIGLGRDVCLQSVGRVGMCGCSGGA